MTTPFLVHGANGVTMELLVGDLPRINGAAGAFPTGFAGGEAFDFDLRTYEAETPRDLRSKIEMFNQEGHYIWKFLGDASLSRSARTYMLTNSMPNRFREMGRLEEEKYLRRPRSVRIDSEFRLFIADYESYRIQVYQKDPRNAPDNQLPD